MLPDLTVLPLYYFGSLSYFGLFHRVLMWFIDDCGLVFNRVLSMHQIRGMPVVDKSGRVLGLISGKEVLVLLREFVCRLWLYSTGRYTEYLIFRRWERAWVRFAVCVP